MPYQVGSRCFASWSDAQEAYAAASVPVLLSGGTRGELVQVVPGSKLGAGAPSEPLMQYMTTDLGSSSVTMQNISVYLPSCTVLDTADALALSWAVIAVWVVAFGYMQMRRAAV